MKKILLINYYGTCDKNGKAIGHSSKVLKEYGELLKDEYEIDVAASPCLINEISGEQARDYHKIHSLKYNIVTDNTQSLWKRIKDKFKLFYNIYQVFQMKDQDILWFYRTDFFLALYFYLFISVKSKKNRKIVVLLYQNSFAKNILGRILNYIYFSGFQKTDGIISTQKGLKDLGIPVLCIPDYYYDARKYEKYRVTEKEDKVVCVGTMSPYKQIIPLVKAFSRNGFPLEIRGYFYDMEQYRQALEGKEDNIVIENAILTEEEYYYAIAQAKYAVLPYDMGQYQSRTSGVLQECVFLDTIAIAPKQLLQENQIEGIGYQNIEELAAPGFFEKDFNINYSDKKKEFDMDEIKRRLNRFMDNV